MKDIRLLNEAVEDARVVLKRLQRKHGHDLEPLGEITSSVTTQMWIQALEAADLFGSGILASAKAYTRRQERNGKGTP